MPYSHYYWVGVHLTHATHEVKVLAGLTGNQKEEPMWVVVNIMVPFWIPIIIRHLICRVPKNGTLILTTTHVAAVSKLQGPGLGVADSYRLFQKVLPS